MSGLRLPVLPTLIVFLAVATMIGLGFWQLGRAEEKNALIARYSAAAANGSTSAGYPFDETRVEDALYRRSQVSCDTVLSADAVAGTSASGAKGWAHRAVCRTDGGREARIALGFSQTPQSPAWDGGVVEGVVAPGPRLVADPPAAGLEPLARPDPGDLPNNHMAYAVQWFLFAATALIIYLLALRRRSARSG